MNRILTERLTFAPCSAVQPEPDQREACFLWFWIGNTIAIVTMLVFVFTMPASIEKLS
jgi:hypothetical protein